MKNLTTAIMTRFTDAPGGVNNDFYDDVNGRLFKGRADDGAEYPYAVFMMISDVPDDAFAKKGESVMIQFSLFSSASSSSEVEDMYMHLKELYDDCSLTIKDPTTEETTDILIWMKRENAILMVEDEEVPGEGTRGIWHYAVDYEITTEEV